MTKFDFGSKPTVQEMQTWNKRYKLGEDTTRVIDTFDDGEFRTIHPNEAYNLCITLNEQHETIGRLKQNIDELLSVDVEEELLKEKEELKQLVKEFAENPTQHNLWKLRTVLKSGDV